MIIHSGYSQDQDFPVEVPDASVSQWYYQNLRSVSIIRNTSLQDVSISKNLIVVLYLKGKWIASNQQYIAYRLHIYTSDFENNRHRYDLLSAAPLIFYPHAAVRYRGSRVSGRCNECSNY